jgi:hypothetical protein
MFRKLNLFLSSVEEGKTPTLLGPLERAYPEIQFLKRFVLAF